MEKLHITKIRNLDYLTKLLNLAHDNEMYPRVVEIADRLYLVAKETYEAYQLKRFKGEQINLSNNRPLVYYFGASHLFKGVALQKMKRYDEALQCIDKYAELGWFYGLDDEGLEVVEQYRFFAAANRLAVEVLKGNKSILDAYVNFLQNDPEEVLPGCVTILEASLAHGWDIKEYLTKFTSYNESFTTLEHTDNINLFVHYLFCLALYNKAMDNKSVAIDNLLNAIASSIRLEENKGFRKCVALFEILRDDASPSQVKEYKLILEGEIKNEENFINASDYFRTV